MRDLEIELQEIFNWIYQTNSEDTAPHLEIGIWNWDDEHVNYTFYAVIKNRNNGSILCGESSYDSKTVTEAIECVVKELYE